LEYRDMMPHGIPNLNENKQAEMGANLHKLLPILLWIERRLGQQHPPLLHVRYLVTQSEASLYQS